jgi:hypothetical protein
MRLTALACCLLLAFAASASAAPRVQVRTVPGASEGLAVDGGAAFVLQRTQHPALVRVALATGRRTTVFRTDGIPGDFAAAGGVLGLTVDVPDGRGGGTTQLVAIPTAGAAGGAVVLRAAPDQGECAPFMLDGVTAAGELLVSTITGRCGSNDATEVVTAIGPAGERVLSTATTLSAPVVTAVTGSWELQTAGAGAVRLVNVETGRTATFRATLPHAQMSAHDLQPDGRFLLTETVLRRHGGSVDRIRLIAPGDASRGGRVLGTVGTPPRIDARFCGGRLVVSRTKDHRTRILVGDREVARISTSSIEPDLACDTTHLVITTSQRGTSPTRLAVVPLR